MVIPRSTEIQAAEDAFELALVGLVGGTRPVVSTATVYSFLYSEFELTMNDVELRRHHPEDFIARFRRRADRDRVLASRPGGYLLPLTWRPWQRTSLATAESFNFQVVVGMLRVPLHARNVATAQIILGPSCSGIEITRLRDIPDDDDREFFVKAWCKHPDLIEDEQTISIPEPVLPVAVWAILARHAFCSTRLGSGWSPSRIGPHPLPHLVMMIVMMIVMALMMVVLMITFKTGGSIGQHRGAIVMMTPVIATVIIITQHATTHQRKRVDVIHPCQCRWASSDAPVRRRSLLGTLMLMARARSLWRLPSVGR